MKTKVPARVDPRLKAKLMMAKKKGKVVTGRQKRSPERKV